MQQVYKLYSDTYGSQYTFILNCNLKRNVCSLKVFLVYSCGFCAYVPTFINVYNARRKLQRVAEYVCFCLPSFLFVPSYVCTYILLNKKKSIIALDVYATNLAPSYWGIYTFSYQSHSTYYTQTCPNVPAAWDLACFLLLIVCT